MKKIFCWTLFLAILFSLQTTVFAQRSRKGNSSSTTTADKPAPKREEQPPADGPESPDFDPFANIRDEEGRCPVSKMAELSAVEFGEVLNVADKDGDGFLSKEEQKQFPFLNPNNKAAQPQGPIGPDMGKAVKSAKTKDGKLEIEKFLDAIRSSSQKIFSQYDKDGDGYLDDEELRAMDAPPGEEPPQDSAPRRGGRGPSGRPGPGGRGGFSPFANIRDEEGRCELSQIAEVTTKEFGNLLENADEDGDGYLDEEEQEELPFFLKSNHQGPRPQGPMGEGIGKAINDAKTKDGKIEIEKFLDSARSTSLEHFAQFDKNGDGYLDDDELRDAFTPPEGAFPRRRGNGPAGGPDRPDFDPFANIRDEEGRCPISKIADVSAVEFGNFLKNADKDGDGLLDEEEQKPFPFPNRSRGSERQGRGDGPERGRPNGPPMGGPMMGNGMDKALNDAKTEDGKIDIEKLLDSMRTASTEFFSQFDKDEDGYLDDEELKAMATPPQGRMNRPDRGREGGPDRNRGERPERAPRGQRGERGRGTPKNQSEEEN